MSMCRTLIPVLALMVVFIMPASSSQAETGKLNKKRSETVDKKDENGLIMTQVRAFATPASGGNGAVFMDITNTTAGTIAITSATSPVSKKAELHTHKHEDGVMKMRPVKMFSIPGDGGTHSLKPGGDHIMLLNLTMPLREGRQFPLTLNFAERKAQAVTVHVVKPGGDVPKTQKETQ